MCIECFDHVSALAASVPVRSIIFHFFRVAIYFSAVPLSIGLLIDLDDACRTRKRPGR
jgi:hypothetical protein